MSWHINDSTTQDELKQVISKQLGEPMIIVTTRVEELHGGTVAAVHKVSGLALDAAGKTHEYQVVLKRQRAWNRPYDERSWHREYDWIHAGFDLSLPQHFRMPKCYLATRTNEETKLWMEYVVGESGSQLSLEMMEKIAYELGCFHARSIHQIDSYPKNRTDLSFLKNELMQWIPQTYDYDFLCSVECRLPEHVKSMLRRHPWNDEYSIHYHYLRSDECDIPKHLKTMIIDVEIHMDEILLTFQANPMVINHRDFWHENIIYCPESIFVLDWDCAGLGYLGEDLASLIGDDTKTDLLVESMNRLLPAYRNGLRTGIVDFSIRSEDMIHMILIKYGYRLIRDHLFSDDYEDKVEIIRRLQTLFELKS